MNQKSPPNPSRITAPKGNPPGYLQSSGRSSADILSSPSMGNMHLFPVFKSPRVISHYDAMFNYEPLTHDNTILDTTHLANEDGKIINKDVTPYFTTQCIDASSSYETLNFALYFQDKGDLKCCANTLEEVEVNHEGPCLHKQCIRYFYDRNSERFKYYEKCPDKITQEDLDRHWKTTSIAENQTANACT